MLKSAFLGIVLAALQAAASPASRVQSLQTFQARNTSNCRCFPGDPCWPSAQVWAQFNQSLAGKLIATVPIASACHDDQFSPYDQEACARLQSVWDFPETHYTTSSSVMAPYFANASCDPFTDRSAQCVIGTYVQYAVNASSASDYQKTLAFAQEHNIRFVIRNTGHDYFGKSTGAGAIALWTHNMKDISIVDHSSTFYTGKAIKMGAGVQAFEAQNAAHAAGLVTIGGNCPTVGIAGGYSQGGGHGPLASKWGLAADQVLEWVVITVDGRLLTATPTQNQDLYWAMSGGGPGTYAVAVSMTAKLHPDCKVAAANLTFASTGVSQDTFYSIISTFVTSLPAIVDAGATSIWLLTNTTFVMYPTTAPGLSVDQLQSLMNPTLHALQRSNISYNYYINEFPSYLDSYHAMNPPSNVTEFNLGGRLIPRSLVSSKTNTDKLVSAMRSINNNGGIISGVSVNVSKGATSSQNSVNPVWRDALFDAVVGTPWLEAPEYYQADLAGQTLITNTLLPKLEDITPNGGAYINEGDFRQPDWQNVFYGTNYDKLRAIKAKYDPQNFLYAVTGVGSEAWTQTSDHRLCAAQ